jgi:hypothetical protein
LGAEFINVSFRSIYFKSWPAPYPAASGLVHRQIVMGYGAALKAYTAIRLRVDRQKIPLPFTAQGSLEIHERRNTAIDLTAEQAHAQAAGISGIPVLV